jgi:hypothetical protein
LKASNLLLRRKTLAGREIATASAQARGMGGGEPNEKQSSQASRARKFMEIADANQISFSHKDFLLTEISQPRDNGFVPRFCIMTFRKNFLFLLPASVFPVG